MRIVQYATASRDCFIWVWHFATSLEFDTKAATHLCNIITPCNHPIIFHHTPVQLIRQWWKDICVFLHKCDKNSKMVHMCCHAQCSKIPRKAPKVDNSRSHFRNDTNKYVRWDNKFFNSGNPVRRSGQFLQTVQIQLDKQIPARTSGCIQTAYQ